ncbi:MAG: sulfite exporter TauE/SafE family protein [Desulfobacteraceae bacterium]|nr:MAG: sulfite exporter TauE/SafE family protein [Desulfobacteraceae bacterium]
MYLYELFSMFVLGILGTGHCLGMCGPLVFAFPGQTGKFSSHIYYHAGRMLTYATVGAAMGGIGSGLAGVASAVDADPLMWISRLEIGFSLLAAAFLIYFGLIRLGFFNEPNWMASASPLKIPGYGTILRSAVEEKKGAGMVLLGLVFGFLPCGLSYAAFARALAAGSPQAGGLLLLAFAFGTLPGLLILGTGLSRFARRFRRHSDLLSGILMIAMGLSLAADGLNAIL